VCAQEAAQKSFEAKLQTQAAAAAERQNSDDAARRQVRLASFRTLRVSHSSLFVCGSCQLVSDVKSLQEQLEQVRAQMQAQSASSARELQAARAVQEEQKRTIEGAIVGPGIGAHGSLCVIALEVRVSASGA
jgi:hypothetical protein